MEAALNIRASQPSYEPPLLAWREDSAQREPIVWWAVFVGFLYFATLAWSSYCTFKGGRAETTFSWWRGWKVTCYR